MAETLEHNSNDYGDDDFKLSDHIKKNYRAVKYRRFPAAGLPLYTVESSVT